MVPVNQETIAESKDRGAWIQTFTGRTFYPLDPRPEEIDIEDIAHALSMQCRFTGHVKKFYSVAEHSVRVSWMIDKLHPPTPEHAAATGFPHNSAAFWGLMHDASEAYLIDVARPVKYLPAMDAYRKAEKQAMLAICMRFGLDPQEPPIVKESDSILLAVEARDLMGPLRPGWERWTDYIAMAPEGFAIHETLQPHMAKAAFMTRFSALGGK